MSNAHRAGVELALYKLAELLDHADRITTEQRVGSQQRHIMCDVFAPITGLSRNHADSPQTSTETTTRTTNKHGDVFSYENDRRGSPRPGDVTGGVAVEIFHTCGYLNLKRRFEVLLNHGITTFIMMTESGRNSVSVMQDALTELTTGVETSQGNARDSGAVSVTPGRLYDGGVFDEPQAHISVDTQPSVSGASSAHGGEQSSAGATVEQVGIVGSNVSTPGSQTAATETITIEKPADSHPDTGGESVDDASGDAARNTTNTTATATDEAGTAAMPDETGRPLIAWQLPREFEQSVTLGTPISPGLIDEDNLHALPDTLR
ncbi:hypothetical protein [Halovenus sp. HT40]|uniref:hypothetical protein n=1 Tax=Halovenus sp. HT40 TaxID=3126691 RepID=UPI00300F5CEC